EKELVAYLTATAEQHSNDLRVYLKDRLPEYMVPSYFVQLEEIPLTANGKVDKRSLPAPEGLGLSSGVEYVAARDEMESRLVEIWERVLQREQIGVFDDFFALGGHSLKAVRLSNEYLRSLSVRVSLQDLFTNTSIASHAVLINSAASEEFIRITKAENDESYVISDAQRRLLVLNQFDGGSIAYNMPTRMRLNAFYDVDIFRRAVNATIDRHEILRTVFREDENGELRQWIVSREELGFELEYKDYRDQDDTQALVDKYINDDAYQPFDLEKGPLLRAALMRTADEEFVLYYNMHHIISDGWSMEILTRDVGSFYEAFLAESIPELPALRIQYKDYSVWQHNQLTGVQWQSHREYWINRLSGELPLLNLPGSKQRPVLKTYNGQGLTTYLDQSVSDKLHHFVKENGGSLFMSLMSAWKVLMYRYTAQTDLVIGTPVAGRDHADLEDQIGFYVNTLALRSQLNPLESFDRFYNDFTEQTLNAFSHQIYPFDRLIEELDLQRDTSRSAVFDVMLTLQNNGSSESDFELTQKELNEIVSSGVLTSKFDLDITFQETGNYIVFHVAFNPDIYDRDLIERLMKHFRQLLATILESPETKISEIDYL
ncbi:MAG: condensation domain-containing protein, partial [Cyclobacteriaceae bacterium]